MRPALFVSSILILPTQNCGMTEIQKARFRRDQRIVLAQAARARRDRVEAAYASILAKGKSRT